MSKPVGGQIILAHDELFVRTTILKARRSESRPDRGIVGTFIEVLNQKREVLMSKKMVNFVRGRERAGRK